VKIGVVGRVGRVGSPEMSLRRTMDDRTVDYR
jgi:hypothetical protein